MKNFYNKILLQLCRWSFSKIAKPISKAPLGTPYVRDADNICEVFTPLKRKLPKSWAECESDGHYLCKECALFKGGAE